MTLESETDFRKILKKELENRCAKNPRYSLRSFARDLDIAPARLSDVLRGRYGLSRNAAERIGLNLGWTQQEIFYFCDLIEGQHARSQKQRLAAQSRLTQRTEFNSTHELTMDAFRVISDWYHYAILELTLLEDFKSDHAWIAPRLGISPHLVEMAIARLTKLDLLEERNGRLHATDALTASPDGIPSKAVRKFHRQILEKALSALSVQKVDERDFSSMMLAVRQEQLPEAKQVIKSFRREFDQRFGKSKKKDSVYCLSIQFFRMSEKA